MGRNGSYNGEVGGEDEDDLGLNSRALEVANELIEGADWMQAAVHEIAGATVVDCGIDARGGIAAGHLLVEACMADMGGASIRMDRLAGRPCPVVEVQTESPVFACLLSQYAGWKVQEKKFFAMTSGPIRALVADEKLFETFDYAEHSDVAVAVMETSELPPASVVRKLAKSADVDPENLVVLAAPTASLCGSIQVVARSVETCIHKLLHLEFDVRSIKESMGRAYLPPIPKDDLVAIGRTNDSILFGAEVMLWVDCDDAAIEEVGPKLPASASKDYGRPFAEVFKNAGGDFYEIDPLLFSPALVFVNNLRTGSAFQFGKTDYDLLAESFYGVK
jgi:methenyltetrahydromethanopterin cyclohydrolase